MRRVYLAEFTLDVADDVDDTDALDYARSGMELLKVDGIELVSVKVVEHPSSVRNRNRTRTYVNKAGVTVSEGGDV